MMGYPLYCRLGFEDYYRIAIYLWPGEAEKLGRSVGEHLLETLLGVVDTLLVALRVSRTNGIL